MITRLFLSIIILFSFVTYSYGQKRTFSCIDEDGNILYYFESNYIWAYSEGMALFKTYTEENDIKIWRAGFLDDKGNVAIPAKFDSKDISKYGFRNGVSWVKMPGEKKYTLIDKTGKELTEDKYDDVGYFRYGLCAVYKEDKMGFVNIKGTEIIPCEYVGDTEFGNGLIFVAKADDKEKKYGFLNEYGRIVIPFVFQENESSRFYNGECVVKRDGRMQLINTKGDVIFNLEISDNMQRFSEGLSLSYIKKDKLLYGFINKNNEWVIAPEYESATNFNNGKSIVSKDGKYGVIDTKGNELMPLTYDLITGNCERIGYFKCIEDKKITYYNCECEKFTDEDVQKIRPKRRGNYYPYRDNYNKWGYLNQDGTVHIHSQYDFVESFSEGKAWIY